MTDVQTIAISTTCTIGVLVFGQMFQRMFVEPIQEFLKTKSKVASAITRYYSLRRFWADDETGDGETVDMVEKDPQRFKDARNELTTLAADLRALPTIIPFYGAFAFLRILPTKQVLKRVTMDLEMWSYGIYSDRENDEYTESIDKALRLKVLWYYDHTGIYNTKKKKTKLPAKK